MNRFSKITALGAVITGVLAFGLWLHKISTPMVPAGDLVEVGYGHKVDVTSHNIKFVTREEFNKHFVKKQSKLSDLSDLLVPPAEAAFGTPTITATPGANVNLQLASPQASAAYVKCDFAVSPFCKIYANATVSTLALVNGIDGQQYTVEIVEPGPANTVAVPTSGGTPAGITTQVAGWAVQGGPLGGAIAAPTLQAQSITIWTLYYDSSQGAFIGIVN